MAITVKTFSSNLKIKAKKEVFNIIAELELQSINKIPIITSNQVFSHPGYNNFTSTSTQNNNQPTETFIPALNQNYFWPTENTSSIPNVQSLQPSFMTYDQMTHHNVPETVNPQNIGLQYNHLQKNAPLEDQTFQGK